MLDVEVITIKDLILYQYAKIMAKKKLSSTGGAKAKKQDHIFLEKNFRDLRNGKIKWSRITREIKRNIQAGKECIFCGRQEDLIQEHLIPVSLKIKPDCDTCDVIHGPQNEIWACGSCNSKKGTKGIYEFYKVMHPKNKNYYDLIPPVLEKRYLSIIYKCHECAATLEREDIDRDGKISVLDIDYLLRLYS